MQDDHIQGILFSYPNYVDLTPTGRTSNFTNRLRSVNDVVPVRRPRDLASRIMPSWLTRSKPETPVEETVPAVSKNAEARRALMLSRLSVQPGRQAEPAKRERVLLTVTDDL